MKQFISLLVLLGVIGYGSSAMAASGGAVAPTGTVRIAGSAAAISRTLWASNTAYVAGQMVKIDQFVCIAETNGTSGATAPAINLASSVADGTVRWRPCLRGPRSGVVVQNWSTIPLYVSFGPKGILASGIGLVGNGTTPGSLALAGPDEAPQGEIYISTATAGAVYTILEW